jgi:hypothetical protein
MRLDVSTLGDYLLTIEEARALMRMSRKKFIDDYIKTQKIPVTVLEDKRKMIRRIHIYEYLEEQKFVFQAPPRRRHVRG